MSRLDAKSQVRSLAAVLTASSRVVHTKSRLVLAIGIVVSRDATLLLSPTVFIRFVMTGVAGAKDKKRTVLNRIMKRLMIQDELYYRL